MYGIADIHGDIKPVIKWINQITEEKQNMKGCNVKLVVLGDAGLNYSCDIEDYERKAALQNAVDCAASSGVNIDLLFVRGNHDCRPENISTYFQVKKYGGDIYSEKDFPNLLFLKDGGVYLIDGNKYFVLGGGFSEDFFERILNGYSIWKDQELSDTEFKNILNDLNLDGEFSVLSHVAPAEIAQVVRRKKYLSLTEKQLQTIYERYKLNIKNWYLGHYHIEKTLIHDKTNFQFVFQRVITM